MPTKTCPFDVAEHLDNPETIVAYLNDAGDIRDVIRAEAYRLSEPPFCLYTFARLSREGQTKMMGVLAEEILRDKEAGRPRDLMKYFHYRCMLAVAVASEQRTRPT